MASKKDERVDKRRVTMTVWDVVEGQDKDGNVVPFTRELKAVDFVRPDILDAYVADAKTRWTRVEVSDEPDAGPAGYDGPTTVGAQLDHPLAGSYYPATGCKNCKHAPEGYTTVKEG